MGMQGHMPPRFAAWLVLSMLSNSAEASCPHSALPLSAGISSLCPAVSFVSASSSVILLLVEGEPKARCSQYGEGVELVLKPLPTTVPKNEASFSPHLPNSASGDVPPLAFQAFAAPDASIVEEDGMEEAKEIS
ncbi:unnamed protein product [Lepidochelys kempii]